MTKYAKTELNKVVRGPKRASYDKDLINQIVDAGFLCHIAYVYEDVPIVIPMAYGRIEDNIYIHGSLKNRMLNHLLKMDQLSLTITHLDGLVLARSAFHHSANYRSATIFGTVHKVEDPKEKMRALKYIVNQMVDDHWEYIRKPNQKEFDATLVLKINIKTASAKVRAEGVIDEKEDLNLTHWAGVVPIKHIALQPIPDEALDDRVRIPDSVLKYLKLNT